MHRFRFEHKRVAMPKQRLSGKVKVSMSKLSMSKASMSNQVE